MNMKSVTRSDEVIMDFDGNTELMLTQCTESIQILYKEDAVQLKDFLTKAIDNWKDPK